MFILKPSRLWFVEIYMGLLRLLYIMDQIYFELIKYNHQLERWYYGHFHESATTNIGNVIFKMLDIEEMCELPLR